MSGAAGLGHYLYSVQDRIREQLDAQPFHPSQVALIDKALASAHAQAQHDALGHPLSTVYLIARAHERSPDRQAEHVGAFCLLYLLSLDLFDDVQDDDLATTPLAEAGSPIAINTAIALLFLAGDQLRLAIALEADADRRAPYLELYARVSLQAVAGQHRDLMGASGAMLPDEVLQMQQAKTSSLVLLAECGALLAGCDAELQARYRTLGEQMARFIQIRDDLRDIFGKEVSPDLATGKNSYPVACFLSEAQPEDAQRFHQLLSELPASLGALRTLLYEAGAVRQAAEMLQQCRQHIHLLVVDIAPRSAPLRVLLDVVDALAEDVYVPPVVAQTAALWQPPGAWHERVRAELERFVERITPLGLPEPPQLRPWHQPHWLYAPAKRTIYYPDNIGLPEEVLPFHMELLGTAESSEAAALLQEQIPALVAHEMFHFWRDDCGRLSTDYWHEEWVANTLAVSYCSHFVPEVLPISAAYAERVLSAHTELLDEQAHQVLARCRKRDSNAGDYQMELLPMAVTGMAMIADIIRQQPTWPASLHELLPSQPSP